MGFYGVADDSDGMQHKPCARGEPLCAGRSGIVRELAVSGRFWPRAYADSPGGEAQQIQGSATPGGRAARSMMSRASRRRGARSASSPSSMT